MSIRQRLSWWWHWWFGRNAKLTQIGDFVYISDTSMATRDIMHEIRGMFRQQIGNNCWRLKCEVIGEVILTYTRGFPGDQDPLSRRSMMSWKSQVMQHTRRSWPYYQRKLLAAQARFPEGPPWIV